MNYHNITTDDMLNGDGLRVVLWVAGCNHHCTGCQNPTTWDPNSGIAFDEAAKQELYEELSKDYISGITFSGGDPLHPSNRDTIFELIKEIKLIFPTKTIWLYTGFLWKDIYTLPLLSHVDILVDGKFQIQHKDTKLKWKGSSNQRVIDVKKTFVQEDKSKPILYNDKYSF